MSVCRTCGVAAKEHGACACLKRQRCESCRHWRCLEAYDDGAMRTYPEVGTCRRYPPIAHPPMADEPAFNLAYWPLTPIDAACGEFQPKETVSE